MIKYEDECEELYLYDKEELCEDCLKKQFKTITL